MTLEFREFWACTRTTPFWFHDAHRARLPRDDLRAKQPRAIRTGNGIDPSENVCYPAKLVHGHIESLLDKESQRFGTPALISSKKLTDADNNFNCPVVATYPEVIRNNMERLNEPGVKFISPFINFRQPRLPARTPRAYLRAVWLRHQR